MFNKLDKQIDAIDEKRRYLEADWEEDQHPLLDFYVKTMPLVVNAERCSIFIYDPESMTIWLKAGTGLEERDIEVSGTFESVVGSVISTGQHKIVAALDKENGIHKETDEKTGFVTRDILCIPIKSLDGSKVMGAVQLLNKQDGSPFNDKDRALLEEMAHYLELTIENIFFNQEVTGVLRSIFKTLTTIVTILVWIVGLTVVLILGRILWVAIQYSF